MFIYVFSPRLYAFVRFRTCAAMYSEGTAAYWWTRCPVHSYSEEGHSDASSDSRHRLRALLSSDAGDGGDHCSSSNMPFVSDNTMHETHILLFLIGALRALAVLVLLAASKFKLQRLRRDHLALGVIRAIQGSAENTEEPLFSISPSIDGRGNAPDGEGMDGEGMDDDNIGGKKGGRAHEEKKHVNNFHNDDDEEDEDAQLSERDEEIRRFIMSWRRVESCAFHREHRAPSRAEEEEEEEEEEEKEKDEQHQYEHEEETHVEMVSALDHRSISNILDEAERTSSSSTHASVTKTSSGSVADDRSMRRTAIRRIICCFVPDLSRRMLRREKSHTVVIKPAQLPRFILYTIRLHAMLFMRQFTHGITRLDLEQCRKSFHRKHLLPPNFDFFEYLKRCVDDDLSEVVDVHWIEWLTYLIYILIVSASQILLLQFTLPIVVLILLQFNGVQVQSVLFSVAVLHEDDEHTTDRHFFFGWPKLLLWMLRVSVSLLSICFAFTLFIVWKEGLNSCYFNELNMHWGWILYHGLFFMIGIAYIGYIKVPNYSLVAAMGTRYNDEALSDVLDARGARIREQREREEARRKKADWLRNAAAREIQRKWRERRKAEKEAR